MWDGLVGGAHVISPSHSSLAVVSRAKMNPHCRRSPTASSTPLPRKGTYRQPTTAARKGKVNKRGSSSIRGSRLDVRRGWTLHLHSITKHQPGGPVRPECHLRIRRHCQRHGALESLSERILTFERQQIKKTQRWILRAHWPRVARSREARVSGLADWML